MRVYVEYSVPVLVEVDLDDEAVVSVRVDDEQVEEPMAVTPLEGGTVSDRTASRAIAVSWEVSWPAWEYGL